MTNQNPCTTPDTPHGTPRGAGSPGSPAAVGDLGSVWEGYRQSVTELAQAQTAALQEADTAAAQIETAITGAQADLDQARADRVLVEERVGPFETEVAQILADAGVSPDGAGSGTAELPVQTSRDALTVMDGLIAQLRQTSTELDAAREYRSASTTRWTAVGVILAATLVTVVVLGLLGAPGYVQVAGAVTAFCATWPTRARGWVTAAITGGIATGVLVAIVALTGQVLSAILLLLGAVGAVIWTARAGIVRSTRVTPTSGPPGPRR